MQAIKWGLIIGSLLVWGYTIHRVSYLSGLQEGINTARLSNEIIEQVVRESINAKHA